MLPMKSLDCFFGEMVSCDLQCQLYLINTHSKVTADAELVMSSPQHAMGYQACIDNDGYVESI